MIVGTNERIVTIYTINNDKYTDFDSCIPPDNCDNGDYYDYSSDYNEVISEIVDEFYSKFTGYYEHKVKIKLIYGFVKNTRDFSHGMNWQLCLTIYTYLLIEILIK